MRKAKGRKSVNHSSHRRHGPISIIVEIEHSFARPGAAAKTSSPGTTSFVSRGQRGTAGRWRMGASG